MSLATTNRSVEKPSSLACLACRRKHLKCDGVMPICGRCRKTQLGCHYTPSRRGYKPSSRNQYAVTYGPAPVLTPSFEYTVPAGIQLTPQLSTFSFVSTPLPGTVTTNEDISSDQSSSVPTWATTEHPSNNNNNNNNNSLYNRTSLGTDKPVAAAAIFPGLGGGGLYDAITGLRGDSYLIDIYYAYFHDSHPILPPAHFLPRLYPLPACLEATIKFIGAHFVSDISPDAYRPAVTSAIAQSDESCYKVQSLLLLSIALHGRNERGEGVKAFTEAAVLAMKLGMNMRTFAPSVVGEDAVLCENIRRTWWEVYMIDAMFSGFDQTPCQISSSTIMDVPLPCDDLSYSAGIYLTESPTAAQFYDRIFEDEEGSKEYSSYCHAIEASRVLKRTLNLTYAPEDPEYDQIESIDANIGSWFHHLSPSKRDILAVDDQVDQVMFRAFMIIHCASIYLHTPQSNLLSTPVAISSIPCGRRWIRLLRTNPSSNLTHAIKSIKAANGLANLAALRSPSIKHSPFFICGMVLSALVQLCACSVRASGTLEPRRDRIALLIGELKSLGPTWSISKLVMRHIKMVAREVLDIGVRPPAYSTTEDTGPDIVTIVNSDLWLGDIPLE
ncbi:hypothetical protein McanMca71_003420 [Microsporum canis]|uniref:Zn(2)-C6 fungal-type domain-containing protein n=1 Tax=Arthroderma otae (strain ATCC MYA-4605 / CBS 113480) TaxID=554155 RepID=C5FSN4_ARTOC|nr:conserved hypothetical protein [Microsporum canis CBS 113480]EEQ32887.1 conserved hypothetical protein [Microsporum canis CBS 113480]